MFDDFQAAAQYLVKRSIASPSTLGIMGGSNGGIVLMHGVPATGLT